MFSKDQSLAKIAINSGNLAGRLSRASYNLDYSKLAMAFEYSIAHGGMNELEFKRPEGQSYNPRPARIALILIESKTTLDTNLLAASFLACSKRPDSSFREAFFIANASIELLQRLKIKSETPTTSEQSILLALALHLDHARHFHLGELIKNSEENKIFCELTEKLVILAQEKNLYLHLTIQHWLKRHLNKHSFSK